VSQHCYQEKLSTTLLWHSTKSVFCELAYHFYYCLYTSFIHWNLKYNLYCLHRLWCWHWKQLMLIKCIFTEVHFCNKWKLMCIISQGATLFKSVLISLLTVLLRQKLYKHCYYASLANFMVILGGLVIYLFVKICNDQ